MTRRKNRSNPPSPRIPVPDELYAFACRLPTIASVQKNLICGHKVALALRKNDRSLRLTPLEVESMQLQMRRMVSLTPVLGIRQLFRDPSPRQMKYVDLMHAAATFAVEHAEVLDKFKRKSQRPRLFSTVAWHRPLYELADLMSLQLIPHMKQVWQDFPECRELFFGETGFEEKYIRKVKGPSK